MQNAINLDDWLHEQGSFDEVLLRIFISNKFCFVYLLVQEKGETEFSSYRNKLHRKTLPSHPFQVVVLSSMRMMHRRLSPFSM